MDTAILITYDREDAINEAKGLCDAAGYEVFTQLHKTFYKNENMELVVGY